MSKKDNDKKKKHNKKGKGKSGGGKNAFSKDYKPKPPKKLDNVYKMTVTNAVDKDTKGGNKAVVLSVKVAKEKVTFNHYLNYQSDSDTAMALANQMIRAICKENDIEIDKDEFVENVVGCEFYGKIKTTTSTEGYTNYNIQKVIPQSDIEED